MGEASAVRFCLDVISEVPDPVGSSAAAPTGDSKGFSVEAATEVVETSRRWIESDGIQGLGIGEKVRAGESTGELALRVYVDQKRPIEEIEHLVPSTIQVGSVEAATDVIEIGPIEPEIFSDRVRPLRPGVSISRAGDDPGTLGAFVRGRQDDQIYMLSNSHVLADSGRASKGDAVVQPGSGEATSTSDDSVGSLSDFVPFVYSDSGFPVSYTHLTLPTTPYV